VLSAVFIPVAFMGGITGRLYQQFALTIVFSVMISALNALTLSPALSVLLLKEASPSKGMLGRFFAAFNRWFDRLTGGYVRWTGLLIAKTSRGLLLLALATVAAGLLGRQVPGGFLPDEDQGFMMVNVQLPDAASLQRTDEVAKEVEKVLASTPGVAPTTPSSATACLTQDLQHLLELLLRHHAPMARSAFAGGELPGVLGCDQSLAGPPAGRGRSRFLPPAIPAGTASGFSMMLQDRWRIGGVPLPTKPSASWRQRANVPSSPVGTTHSDPPCPRSSPTSIATRPSSSVSTCATSTVRSR
jgi:HAE1 family hydrophobic/amphiphilic exporter-1